MSKTITKVIAGLGVVAGFGAAMLPLSSYAVDKDVTLTVNVGSSIVLDATAPASASLNINAADLTTMFSDITVSTNSTNGYNVKIASASEEVDLKSNGNSIPAKDGEPTAGVSSWALKADQAYDGITSDFNTTWKKLPKASETALTLKNKTGVANKDKTKVLFGVATSHDQAIGTYTGSVRITAVAN